MRAQFVRAGSVSRLYSLIAASRMSRNREPGNAPLCIENAWTSRCARCRSIVVAPALLVGTHRADEIEIQVASAGWRP